MKKFLLLFFCTLFSASLLFAAHVPVSNSSGYTLGNATWGGFNWDDKSDVLSFTGIPDKLSFKYQYSSNSATQSSNLSHMYIEESSDNRTWSTIWENSQPTKTATQINGLQLQKSTRYVRFHYRGNFAGYYKDISVTELKYVEDPEPATLDLGTAAINAGEVTGNVLINWCNVSPLTVTSSSDRFTVTPSSFGGIDQYGSQQLTISYIHGNEAGEHNETITLTNGTYTKEIAVHAATTLRPQLIVWNEQLVATGFAMNAEEVFPNAEIGAIATTANGGEIIYSSDNESVISVSADGKVLTAVGEGTANITATQEGDSEYQPVSDTKTFVVTNLLKQTINWEQNLLMLLTTSEPVTLNATASSGGDITYVSADPAVVSVEGNVLTVVGEGETYITANQAGGEINGNEYLSVSAQNAVIVRNPASQCNGRALTVSSIILNSSRNYQIVYSLSGAPEKLTFSALHGTKSGSFIGFDPIYSPLIVEEYASRDGVWDWYKLYESVVNTSATASGDINLSETATKLRFRTNETGTTHTISNISVTRKKYLRSNVSEIEVEAEANAIWQKEITISHSNIDIMTVECTGPFVADVVTLGEGCGDYGDDKFVVSFTPAVKDSIYTGTITITDGKATPSTIVIPVSVTAKGLNQSILGFELPSQAFVTDEITLAATASSELDVDYLSSDSTIAFVENNVLVILRAGSVDITARQAGNEKYDETSETKTIVISKAPVTISVVPEASELHYGEVLSMSELTGGESSVEGVFAWIAASDTLSVGDHEREVVFTPADTAHYVSDTILVSVHVGKAEPFVDALPVASGLVYGQLLGESLLDGGNASVEGRFAWADSTMLPEAGEHEMAVVFIPVDTLNYLTLNVSVTVAVSKMATVVDTLPQASALVYSQLLGESALIGGKASVEGYFVWADSTLLLASGEHEQTVLFVPADSVNNAVVSISVKVYVAKALPVIEVMPTATELVYGQSLSEAVIEGGETSVGGSFDWLHDSLNLEVGEYLMPIVFMPEDTNYLSIETELTVVVSKLPQAITWTDELAGLFVGDTVVLTALASSELEVEYVVSDPLIACVSGDTLFLLNAGTVTVIAKQEGNSHYAAAENLEMEIVVSEQSQETGFDNVAALGKLRAVYNVNGQLVTTELQNNMLQRGAYIFLYDNGARRVLIP